MFCSVNKNAVLRWRTYQVIPRSLPVTVDDIGADQVKKLASSLGVGKQFINVLYIILMSWKR